MFQPVSLFIGLRYARARTRNQFISLISLVSILGIALGIIVLITVLSVVNGFDREIKKQVFDMIPPITVSGFFDDMPDWKKVESNIQSLPDITGVAPFVSHEALLINGDSTLPVVLIGILPVLEKQVSALPEKMITGRLENLIPQASNIIIGSELSKKLNVSPGENITIATLENSANTTTITPHFKTFHVTGIFKAGGGSLQFDSKIAFIHLKDAQVLNHMRRTISGFHVALKDVYAAPRMSALLQNKLGSYLQVWNWTDQLGDFFDNIRLTKTLMFFIFILIITVAVFNLVCTMIMVVKNKQSDIAILRTLGATRGTILAIFLVQGTGIALCGIIPGLLGGFALASHITPIFATLQSLFHTQFISSEIYFVDYLPAEVQWHDIGIISIAAFLLSLIAAIYPALNAARLNPVEILNNE